MGVAEHSSCVDQRSDSRRLGHYQKLDYNGSDRKLLNDLEDFLLAETIRTHIFLHRPTPTDNQRHFSVSAASHYKLAHVRSAYDNPEPESLRGSLRHRRAF